MPKKETKPKTNTKKKPAKKKTTKKKTKALEKVQPKGILSISESTIKKYLCPDATEEELKLFLNQCVMWKLNPFKREIYLIKYKGQKAHIVMGYEGFLKRAERSKLLDGWKHWTEGKPGESNFKACIDIYRKDWKEPFHHEVYFEEYAQYKTGGGLTKFWEKMKRTMLLKVVDSQGFKRCFPDEMGGMPYISEEMPVKVEELPQEEIKEAEIVKEEEKPKEDETIHEAEVVERPEPEYPPEEPKEELPEKAESPVLKIKQDLQAYFGKEYSKKYPIFKKFLKDLGREKGRKFVKVNEFQKLSLNLGDPDDVSLLSEHMDWAKDRYLDWYKEFGEKAEAEEEKGFAGSDGEVPF